MATPRKGVAEVRAMKVMWNGREVKIPPTIETLLKKRGWTWPFPEEVRQKRLEALKHFVPMSTPLEVLAEMAREDAKWDDLHWYEKQVEKEKQKREQEGGCEDACTTPSV